MKILAVGAALFHMNRRTDGQTDRDDEVSTYFFVILRTILKLLSIFEDVIAPGALHKCCLFMRDWI